MNTLDRLKARQIYIFVACLWVHYLWMARILISYEEELAEYGFIPILVFILVVTVIAHFSERLITHILNWIKMRR